MPVFSHHDYDAHERVLFINNEKACLRAIIAVHNTNRGPSLGGCRLKRYDSEDVALSDALRLSRAMTYKAAAVEIALGGGKSVILDNGRPFDRVKLFEAMAEAVDKLQGDYIVSNDLGTTVHDVAVMRQRTQHARGLPTESGEQEPSTAYGVYQGLKATWDFLTGSPSLRGAHIAIQGVGTVGERLARYLLAEGTRLTIADPSEDRVAQFSRVQGVMITDPKEILATECDILAPCAVGAILNDQSIPRLRTRAVCGAANNQLLEPRHGDMLYDREIVYAPDYIVNAGGLISVSNEGNWGSTEDILHACDRIYQVLTNVLETSQTDGIPPYAVADRFAEENFKRSGSRPSSEL